MLKVQTMIGTVEVDFMNAAPTAVPWIYNWRAEKRCCHWPSKSARRPLSGLSSHPDRGKKADEHCQPSHNLRSRHSLERCKTGSLKRNLCT